MTDKERRFWEKCGFRQVKGIWQTPVVDFKYSDSLYRYECPEGLPDINSLDDLMKYGWDKAIDTICHKKNWHEFTARSWLMHIWADFWNGDKTPAQALFEALCLALEVEG